MKDSLLKIFMAAVRAADPYGAVLRHLRTEGGTLLSAGGALDIGRFKRIVVVGAGKAASPMARAAEEVLGDRIDAGVVVVKYGHSTGAPVEDRPGRGFSPSP